MMRSSDDDAVGWQLVVDINPREILLAASDCVCCTRRPHTPHKQRGPITSTAVVLGRCSRLLQAVQKHSAGNFVLSLFVSCEFRPTTITWREPQGAVDEVLRWHIHSLQRHELLEGQRQRVKIAAKRKTPKTCLKGKVCWKPGDVEWMKSVVTVTIRIVFTN